MTDTGNEQQIEAADGFVWHPEYAGRSFDSVRRELEDDIERDQRAYELALEHAEKEEFDSFNTVREIEKRWSDFDFGWVEVPAKVLADRILKFERGREERQELLSWKEWRAEGSAATSSMVSTGEKTDWRENLSDEQRRKLASALSVLVLVGLALLCVLVYFIVR